MRNFWWWVGGSISRSKLVTSNFSSPLASFGCLSYAKQLWSHQNLHPTPVTSRFMTLSPIATLVPNSQDTELTIEATIKRNSRNACVLGVKNPMVLRSGVSLVKHRKLSCKVTRDSFKPCKCGWLGDVDKKAWPTSATFGVNIKQCMKTWSKQNRKYCNQWKFPF